MEKLVETTEALCDAFENLPSSITDRIMIENLITHSKSRKISIPATSANIRMFYYVGNKNNPKYSAVRGFEQLKWLLTNPMSGWDDLTDDEKVVLLKHTAEFYNDVFVFL